MKKGFGVGIVLLIIVVIAYFILLPNPEQNDDEIKIGAIFSMTGNVGAYGQRSQKGFLLAINEINNQGGIKGKKLHAIIEDAGSEPKRAVNAFNKLVESDKVKIIIGDVLSSTTMAIAPLLDDKKVLLFAPGASHPGLKGISPYFFRNWVSDDYDGFAMAHYARDLGKEKIAILVQNSDYTLGLANAFENEFVRIGGKIIKREIFETNENDLKPQLLKLKQENVNNIYLVGQSRENGIALKQAFELNFSPNWYANLTVETPECITIAGVSAENVVYSTPAFDTTYGNSNLQNFIKSFRHSYNDEPDATAGHAYDAVYIIKTAIERVGTDPQKIAEQIKGLKEFDGVTGLTTFDSDGNVLKNVFIKKIANGKSKFIKEFYYDRSANTSK